MSAELRALGIILLLSFLAGILVGPAWDDEPPAPRRTPTPEV